MNNILLVPDAPGWAYDKKADALIKHLSQYKINKMYYHDYIKRSKDIGFNKQFSTILFFWWDNFDGNPPPTSYKLLNAVATVTSHRYHLSYSEDYYKPVLQSYRKIGATSKKIFNDIIKLHPDTIYCPNGVDHEVYIPKRISKKKDDKLTVGWVAGKIDETLDIKGKERVLKPLMKSLESYNIDFKIIFTDRYSPKYDLKEMIDYYNSLDVYLCTSSSEGTPNPVFEAASCGLPIVSTDVGCVRDLIEFGKNGFLVGSYSDDKGAQKIIWKISESLKYLENNRGECREMGDYSREVILKDWGWKMRAQAYINLFKTEN